MRKVFIASIAGLVVAAILLLAGLSIWLNRLIASRRDSILQSAQTTLGRVVTVDRVTATLWGGIGLQIGNLTIADDSRFSDTPFVRAASVTARAQIWALLHGRIQISGIDLQQLEVHLIRDESGRWNYASLKPFSAAAPPKTSSTAPAVVTVATKTTTASGSPSIIQRVGVGDGTVLFADRSQVPPRIIRATHVDLSINPSAVDQPISVSLDAALQGDARNIHVHGLVGPLQTTPLPLKLDGDLGPLDPLLPRIEEMQLNANVTAERVEVAHLTGQVFGGTFALTGQYPLRGTTDATLNGQLADVSMMQVTSFATADSGKAIDGTAQMVLELRTRGITPDVLRTSVNGNVTTDVRNGVITNFNLVNEVLGRVTGLPGIGDLVSANVKPKYASLFSEPNTSFDTLHASFRIADQRMRTEDLAIVATDYGVHAAGWIAFNRDADLSGTLSMSTRFSNDVVTDIKEAKYLLDDNAQLAVPFRLNGKLGQAKPKPDADRLIALLTRAVGRGAAGELLEGLLGGKSRRRATPGAADSEQRSLEKGLRQLFGR